MVKRAPMRHWNLFLDESGRFDDPTDDVVVAGLLVEEGVPGTRLVEVREAITQIVRGMPWPPKASEFSRPIALALASSMLRRAQGRRAEVPFEEAADRLSHIVAATEPKEYAAVERALHEGTRLPYDSLGHLELRAKEDARLDYATVQLEVDRTVARLGRVLSASAASFSHEEDPRVLFVGCGESLRGEGFEPIPLDDDAGTARYLTLLQLTLARTIDVVRRFGGEHRVFVHVLERGVVDPDLHGPVRLNPPLVRKVLRGARERLGDAWVRGVDIEVATVPRYDTAMDPRLVLADLVANRARRPSGRDLPLFVLERHLAAVVALPLRSGHPAASHLAASGVGQERIDQARHGRSSSEMAPSPTARRWALEQADEWVRVLQAP